MSELTNSMTYAFEDVLEKYGITSERFDRALPEFEVEDLKYLRALLDMAITEKQYGQ